MANANTIQYVNLLASASSSAKPFKITVETDYGLIVEFLPDASINAKLDSSITISSEKAPLPIAAAAAEGSDETKPGYKYRIFPDWGTNHLFYDSSWPFNPQDASNAEDEEILRDHVGTVEETALKAWLEAYSSWANKYDEAFDKEVNQTGDFHRELFSPEVNKAWALEGMMLAVWLALQPKVDSVEFSPGVRKVVFSTKGYGEHSSSLNETLGLFLAELDTYLE